MADKNFATTFSELINGDGTVSRQQLGALARYFTEPMELQTVRLGRAGDDAPAQEAMQKLIRQIKSGDDPYCTVCAHDFKQAPPDAFVIGRSDVNGTNLYSPVCEGCAEQLSDYELTMHVANSLKGMIELGGEFDVSVSERKCGPTMPQ